MELNYLELFLRMEGEFDIEIPDEDVEQLTTVSAILDRICGTISQISEPEWARLLENLDLS